MKVWLAMNLGEWGACITSGLTCTFCSWRLPLTFQAYLLFSRPCFSLAMPSSLNKLFKTTKLSTLLRFIYCPNNCIDFEVFWDFALKSQFVSWYLIRGTLRDFIQMSSLTFEAAFSRNPMSRMWEMTISDSDLIRGIVWTSACCERTWVTTTCPFKNVQEVMGRKKSKAEREPDSIQHLKGCHTTKGWEQ